MKWATLWSGSGSYSIGSSMFLCARPLSTCDRKCFLSWMGDTAWAVSLVCWACKRLTFMFHSNISWWNKAVYFINFFKKRDVRGWRSKVKLRQKRIKLKASHGRRWRWWNAWDLIVYKLQMKVILWSSSLAVSWSLPTSACILALSNKHALTLWHGGLLMVCPLVYEWMNVKLVHLLVKPILLSERGMLSSSTF